MLSGLKRKEKKKEGIIHTINNVLLRITWSGLYKNTVTVSPRRLVSLITFSRQLPSIQGNIRAAVVTLLNVAAPAEARCGLEQKQNPSGDATSVLVWF